MELSREIKLRTEIFDGDRRLTIRLMGLWQGARLAGARCARAKVFLSTLSEDLLCDCCLVVRGSNEAWELRDIGDVLARRSGIAGVKAKLTDLTSGSLLAETIRDIDDAFNLGAPVLHDGETRDKDGRRMLFRSILLPLSDDQGHIRQLLAAARYKAVIDEARRPSA